MQNWWNVWCSAFVHDSVNNFPITFGGSVRNIESGAKIIKVQSVSRMNCFLTPIMKSIKPFLVFILLAVFFVLLVKSVFFKDL